MKAGKKQASQVGGYRARRGRERRREPIVIDLTWLEQRPIRIDWALWMPPKPRGGKGDR